MAKEYKTSEAKREYAKQYYYANHEKQLTQRKARAKKQYEDDPAYINDRNTARRKMLRELIQQQKAGQACMRCGIADPRVLDFHHRDRSTKEGNLGKVVHFNWSKARILKEIAKCDFLCANCHRILHWEEKNGE